jgi:hypothetical protein
MEARAVIELDKPRVVVLSDPKRKQRFSWVMRRITQEDWQKYFSGIVHQAINQGEETERIYDPDTALQELVLRCVDRVEGYGDTSGKANWRNLLPAKHRTAIGLTLRSVGPSDVQPDNMLAELVEVHLDAVWTAGGDGKMQGVNGLVHRFRLPSIEQLKRFNYEASRVRVSGTADRGVTTYPNRQLIAMKMYDELIDSVDGYSVHGEPLADAESIQREMDGAHKASAALALFEGGDSVAIL